MASIARSLSILTTWRLRVVQLFCATVLLTFSCGFAVGAAPGDIDTSFGTNGKVITPISSGDDIVRGVALQPDGRIIAVGYTTGTNNGFALARYNPDGTLDPSFGTGGKVTTSIGGINDAALAVALQADGKILAVGYTQGQKNNFALARYNTDGTLDLSFGTNGKVITPVGNDNAMAFAVALQSDDKIVVVGHSANGPNDSRDDFALVRYNVNGTLDASFGSGGKVITPIGSCFDDAYAVVIQSDGKIVAAGTIMLCNSPFFDQDLALVRYNVDGTLDASFGTSGKVVTSTSSGEEYLFAVATQPDGKIIAAGSSAGTTGYNFLLVRYNIDGTLDTSFGTNGKVLTSNNGIARAILIQPDGKIVATGEGYNGSNYVFLLARYNKDGTPDNSFGINGTVTTSIGSTDAAPSAMALQPDGKIVAAGYSFNGSNKDFALIRYLGFAPSNGTAIIQLSATNYTANEGAGFANLTVNRSGDLSAASTVKYATSDSTDVNFRCDPLTAGQPRGIASRKCDYHLAVGRLRFAAGESTKQIAISIVDDVYPEEPETFNLTLSNPTGATLGTNSSATITITDNDNGGVANPIDGTRFFVRQLYVDLLSREPDQAGWDGWTSRIDLCGQAGQAPGPCDRVTVGGDGFLRSSEFFDRQFFVLRLYRTGLGRIPQYSEVGDLAYVSGFLSSNDLELNKQELVSDIMSRSEFANKYNGLSNLSFVDTLLATAGVSVDTTTHDGWVTALNNSSKTRAQVYREISERQEVSNKYLHEAQVISAYYGFFTRNPDGAYFNFLQRLDSGEITLGDLANAFINAAEYRQRFGQ